jgi:hypothetical protein
MPTPTMSAMTIAVAANVVTLASIPLLKFGLVTCALSFPKMRGSEVAHSARRQGWQTGPAGSHPWDAGDHDTRCGAAAQHLWCGVHHRLPGKLVIRATFGH